MLPRRQACILATLRTSWESPCHLYVVFTKLTTSGHREWCCPRCPIPVLECLTQNRRRKKMNVCGLNKMDNASQIQLTVLEGKQWWPWSRTLCRIPAWPLLNHGTLQSPCASVNLHFLVSELHARADTVQPSPKAVMIIWGISSLVLLRTPPCPQGP